MNPFDATSVTQWVRLEGAELEEELDLVERAGHPRPLIVAKRTEVDVTYVRGKRVLRKYESTIYDWTPDP